MLTVLNYSGWDYGWLISVFFSAFMYFLNVSKTNTCVIGGIKVRNKLKKERNEAISEKDSVEGSTSPVVWKYSFCSVFFHPDNFARKWKNKKETQTVIFYSD